MKTKIIFSGLVGLALILGSCGSSNNVVSNGLIQKRKYKKGFFFKSNKDLRVVRENAKEKNSIVVNGENIEIYDGLSADISPSQDLNTSLALGKESQATKDLIPLRIEDVSIQRNLKETTSPQFISITKTKNGQRNHQAETNSEVISRKSNKRFDNFVEKNTQRGLLKVMRNKAEQAKMASASGSMSNGEIITLILIVVLIILAFTLLNNLTNGWLGWLVGLILTVALIVLILRWLGII